MNPQHATKMPMHVAGKHTLLGSPGIGSVEAGLELPRRVG